MGSGVLGFVAGLVVGIPVGIFGNLVADYLWDGPIKRWRRRRLLGLSDAETLEYLSESDHMYTVVSCTHAHSPAPRHTNRRCRTPLRSARPSEMAASIR